MRFVIHGAGAIGGAIGGRLAQHGHEVVLIARGDHAVALRERGLRLRSPDDDVTLRVTVADDARGAAIGADDVVVLAVKSQDTAAALGELAASAPPEVAIVCAQNGVANERAALRRFANVVAMYVMMPAARLTPGVVDLSCAPVSGQLDVGRYPVAAGAGDDPGAARLAAIAGALAGATFESLVRTDVMRWKYAKLINNLANAVEAACGVRGGEPAADELIRRARSEGGRVLRAAGIEAASPAEVAERVGGRLELRPVGGAPRGGGSSWQSLARGTGAIETDYLNGEIVLLGRLHGIATPVNALLQRVAGRLAHERRPPGSLIARELLEQLAVAS